MITYLYHKRHKQTGLNYFGKTIKNPYVYRGSGVYWTRHLAQHGADIETLSVWEFNDLKTGSKFAVEFSTRHNIVESTEWANLRVENGLDGGYTPSAYTQEARLKKGAKLKGRVYSEETLNKMRSHKGKSKGKNNAMFGRQHNDNTKELMRARALNRERKICEHCKIECSPSNYTRWHGSNCKSK